MKIRSKNSIEFVDDKSSAEESLEVSVENGMFEFHQTKLNAEIKLRSVNISLGENEILDLIRFLSSNLTNKKEI